MYTIINNNTDPRYNLALEEYVLKYLDIKEDIVLLWQNEPAIIVGRNQNTIEEINLPYVRDNNIHVVRRISGGGAVYHDLGNLNFTFITDSSSDNLNNFKKFIQPVIDALASLGVEANFFGRNDIVIENKKISGNAQAFYKDRMFHHGTILFDANLDVVSEALNVSIDKVISKGIKSTRSRVTNVLPYLNEKISVDEFKDILLRFLLNGKEIASLVYELTESDQENILKIKTSKYDTWEWNYGNFPKFQVTKSKRYSGGKVNFNLNIKDGKIIDCKIYGDFFGKKDVIELEDSLIGVLYKEEDVLKVLSKYEINNYFFNITLEEIMECLFY